MRGRARTNVNFRMSAGCVLCGMRGRARTNATYTRPAVATAEKGVRLESMARAGTNASYSRSAVDADFVSCRLACVAGHTPEPTILIRLAVALQGNGYLLESAAGQVRTYSTCCLCFLPIPMPPSSLDMGCALPIIVFLFLFAC